MRVCWPLRMIFEFVFSFLKTSFEYFEIDCPKNFYGRDCQHRCSCQNGGKCDANDGHCFCLSGYTGSRCELLCPQGTYGHLCLQKCQCGSDNVCHPRTGSSFSSNRRELFLIWLFTGECSSLSCNGNPKCLVERQRSRSLISPCPESILKIWFRKQKKKTNTLLLNSIKGFYNPPQCRQKCMCMNNAQCEPLTGRCLCHSGHIGRYCERCSYSIFLFKCDFRSIV